MKITQDVREYAATLGMESTYAIEAGMQQKSAEFRQRGGRCICRDMGLLRRIDGSALGE